MKTREKIEALLAQIQQEEGTTLAGAVRDLLTDLVHICNDANAAANPVTEIDIDERLDAAIEIAAQERLDAIEEKTT
jgi:hypothetical protein